MRNFRVDRVRIGSAPENILIHGIGGDCSARESNQRTPLLAISRLCRPRRRSSPYHAEVRPGDDPVAPCGIPGKRTSICRGSTWPGVMPELFRGTDRWSVVLDEVAAAFDIENILRHNAVNPTQYAYGQSCC